MNENLIEEKITDYFNHNYEVLRFESGHEITSHSRDEALTQVKLYWKKLKQLANDVTETEVKLALPDQRSPKQRNFTIEGVIDIIKENNETWMYDIKTHDYHYIINNISYYQKQLNIYAHIWKGLRGNPLDHTAIICTSLPSNLRDALRRNDEGAIDKAFKEWNPVIPIALDDRNIEELIEDFGETVDRIEDSEFLPMSLKRLKEKAGATNSREINATRICRNCDARFSCDSYRQFAAESQGKNLYNFRRFWFDPIPEVEQEDWVSGNLDDEQINSSIEAADQLD